MTSTKPDPATNEVRPAHWLNRRWAAILLPALFGLGVCALSVLVLEQYGWSLFLMVPIAVGFLSAFCWCFRRRISVGSAIGIGQLSILTLGTMLILFAFDGLICLLMALPLAAVLAIFGSCLGHLASSVCSRRMGKGITTLLAVAVPASVSFEHLSHPANPDPPIRSVTTTLEIDAPIDAIWQTVISFPKISEPPTGLFRAGIAYPIEARIDGEGVGAVRYCVFSTGSFVEPITVWDAPHHLAFDVTENPPPMRELSLYQDLDVPHLHGHMVSKKGEFRLEETASGSVVLTGRTWYTHSMKPTFYWGPISDQIIHRIHRRVLEHIKAEAEIPSE